MAIGNIFDNRGKRERGGEPVPSWREWSGDISFREEDIKYLVSEFKSGNKEPKMTVNGETRQSKAGKDYINVKLKKHYNPNSQDNYQSSAAGEKSVPDTEEPSPESSEISFDDL